MRVENGLFTATFGPKGVASRPQAGYHSLMSSNSVLVLRESVDVLVAEPLSDRCVTELQALIAGIAPQLERLAGLSSLALGQPQAMSGGTVPPDPALAAGQTPRLNRSGGVRPTRFGASRTPSLDMLGR